MPRAQPASVSSPLPARPITSGVTAEPVLASAWARASARLNHEPMSVIAAKSARLWPTPTSRL
eukprot:2904999-Prymnesium_polylepis.1